MKVMLHVFEPRLRSITLAHTLKSARDYHYLVRNSIKYIHNHLRVLVSPRYHRFQIDSSVTPDVENSTLVSLKKLSQIRYLYVNT